MLDRGDVDRCEAGEQPFQRRRARRELTIGPVKTATAPGYEHALDMRSDATGCPRSCSDSRLCRKRTANRQSGVRPDAYADCSQDHARSRPGQYRNRRNQSDQVVVTDRAAGLLLDRRSHPHHLGHGHWLSRVPVWVRRLQVRRRTRVYGTRTRIAVGPQTSRGKV
jgi:hypothetical protein